MIAVATLDDPRIQDYRATADPDALRRLGLFVVEGRLVVRQLLEEADRFTVRSVLVTEAARAGLADAFETRPAVPVYVIAQDAMSAVVGFHIHRGCLALAERPVPELLDEARLDGLSRVLVIEGVSNPDNIGGLFRNAAAFGVDLVVLGPRCGDPLYRKAIRTSMGASLLVRCAEAASWPDAIVTLKHAGFQVLALTPAAEATPLVRITPAARVALMLGSEGEGLSDAALAASDIRARIPMSTRIDSLNVATAAAVALHHLSAFNDR